MLEISSKTNKNGYKKFKLVLAEIFPDDSVVNGVGTLYNDNGITWLRNSCEKNLKTLEDASLTVEFVDEEKVDILGHGQTGELRDGIPILSNATTIGHFKRGYIQETDNKTLLIGEGVLDWMRYPDFIDSLQSRLEEETIFGSVEIVKSGDNSAIKYLYGYKEFGRIPDEFEFSGYALLGCGVEPADKSATLLEVASKNKESEELKVMDEKTLGMITDTVKSAINECNSTSESYEKQISELNSVVAGKEAKIVELNATVEQVQKALDDMEKERNAYWAEREALEKELGVLKAKARLGELNSALEGFTDEEKNYAKEEIEKFNESPLTSEINTIVNKIYSEIGKASKEQVSKQKTAEQNSKKVEIDIFGDIDDIKTEKDDIDIFN